MNAHTHKLAHPIYIHTCIPTPYPSYALLTRARSGHHPAPLTLLSARGTLYWLGIQPHTSYLRLSDGIPYKAGHPSAAPHAPGPCPSSSAALLLSLSPSLLTFAVPLVVLPLSFIHLAANKGFSACGGTRVTHHAQQHVSHTPCPGIFTCSSTRVTHHAHTGSNTASVQVKLKENTAPIQQCW